MQYELILLFIIFMFGIVIGSFLNVCIFRIPKGENIATTGSHCMSCGHRLRWYDLIPLLSWLMLRGRCRYCHSRISVQYPLVETINGFGYVLIFMLNGYSLDSLILCLFTSCILVLSVIDWQTYEIPFGINVMIFVLGLLRTAMEFDNLIEHLVGCVCVSGFLLILNLATKGRAMGGGDVKLMAAAGLLLGAKQIVLGFFLGCIIGSVVHLILMKMQKKGKVLAFGPYLSAGMFVSMLFGDMFVNWYFGMFI